MAIGASAGGLEAIESFLSAVDRGSGLAYVVVQHLSPSDEGRLVALLQRTTPMPVTEIVDLMAVEPDHVYVIPPDRDLSIEGGVLSVTTSDIRRGLRLPIDHFLRSLARDRGALAVAVILSGMGTDGTLGLAAVKEGGGAVFVQDPATAAFDAMPRSAIDSQMADVVAPPDELPSRIAAYMRARTGLRDPQSTQAVLDILRRRTGHDFALYKRRTLERRIDRRIGILDLNGVAEYVDFLALNPQEADLLFKELLIGVTSFFRDPEVWDHLVHEIWPQIIGRAPEGTGFRAWTAGCSTGEEAYTLAMSFVEARDGISSASSVSLQIFATDLDVSAIEQARSGNYSSNIAADVSDRRLSRFFVREGDGYRISPMIREMVIFAPHNVTMDPPFTRLDMVTCRNLLIYLEPVLQQKVLTLFHYALRPDGVLVLGAAETVGAASESFRPIPGADYCYQRTPAAPAGGFGDFAVTFGRERTSPLNSADSQSTPLSLQELTEALLLRHHAPIAVLATRTGDIVYFSGETDRFLAPPAGRANLNLFAMARTGLEVPLEEAFRAALRERRPARRTAVLFIGPNGQETTDLVVEPVAESDAHDGLILVVFAADGRLKQPIGVDEPQSTVPAGTAEEVPRLRDEIERLRSILKVTRDAMQASHEQNQAANEELQSTNEELQSTNEELMTSKEEMQSMNEELQTVNQELEARVDELVNASNDMSNLLNSTSIATLFLDSSLCIRRFTPQVTSIFNLIPRDIGRPITDLATMLDYRSLVDDAREVLRTLIPISRSVSSVDGRWFDVRVMPYRTHDDRIDGVVLTYMDCTDLHQILAAIRSMLEATPSPGNGDPGWSERVESLRSAVSGLVGQSADLRRRWSEWSDNVER